MGILDHAVRLVLEGGIEYVRSENQKWILNQPNLRAGESRFGTGNNRLIIATIPCGSAHTVTFLVRPQPGRVLDMEQQEFMAGIGATSAVLFGKTAIAVAYHAGAVVHHCKRLCEEYVQVVRTFTELPYPGSPDTDRVMCAKSEEPYYEFDSTLASVQRFYEYLRFPIWRIVHPRDTVPRSMRRLLGNIDGFPSELGNRLKQTIPFFDGAKAYRDCMEHHCPVNWANGGVDMRRSEDGVWRMHAWLPDNPEAGKASAFEYKKGTDALSFAWELTAEIVSLATFLRDEVLQ